MGNKWRSIIGVSCLCILITVGCSKRQDMIFLEKRLATLEETNKALLEKIEVLEKEKEESLLVNELSELMMELKGKIAILELREEGMKEEELLLLHTLTANSSKEIAVGAMKRDQTLSIQEQLQVLANSISEEIFQGTPLKVESIQEIGGKKIAIVNMEESNGKTEEQVIEALELACWYRYSGGSAGSMITTTTIIKTLLQPTYKGEWIDGIKLLYNGGEEFIGHMEVIGEIIYRDE